jgi:hypothetical protein
MKSLFNLFRSRNEVPRGFHEYRTEEVAQAFRISDASAAEVVREYHSLFGATPKFMAGINSTDLRSLTLAASEHFQCTKQEAAAIARWFGALSRLLQDRDKAQQLSIHQKMWVSVCQHVTPEGHRSHVAHNGAHFDARWGLLIDREYLFPGALIGCACMGRAVIPGFEED